ncbi:protein N-terminal glutamine amidohydrolase isoform X2 [Entelurus aequoreus]|uniref:protein N-terminal glutamine amidohydrolase isoform X2 n=1 Tax=Entelurus aequoreus TaxID=161455 RepID=UPI002B1E0972|nr:protein N-terminal glutamine amidohydrolase isoform X2 [Entelurus aequoreus]
MKEGRQDGGTDSRQIEENVWKVCEFIRKEKSFPLEEFFVIFISNDNKMVPLWEQKSAQGQQPVIWDYHVVLFHVSAGLSCGSMPCFCRTIMWFYSMFLQDYHVVLFHVSAGLSCGSMPCFCRTVMWFCSMLLQDYHVVLLHDCARSESFLYDLDSVLPFPCNLKMYAKHALRSDHSLSPEYHRKLRVVPADCFLLNFASDRSHMKKEDGSWKMPPPPYPPIRTAGQSSYSSMNLQLFISMEPSVGWGHIFTLDHFLCHFLKDPPCV